MSIKEELQKQKKLILNRGNVDVILFKVKSLLKRYFLTHEQAEENYKILSESWNDNYGNYGAHDSLNKRKSVAGLLNVLIEEIPDDVDHSMLVTSGNRKMEDYIDENIILHFEEKASSSTYKLDRLALVCKEINSSFKNENYFAVVILIRSIIDMAPPIFEKNKFSEVVSNFPLSMSHRKQLETLQNSLRNYADGCIHIQLDKAHPYPNVSNINFRTELSVLLELIKEGLE